MTDAMKMDEASLENQIIEELAALGDNLDDVGTESQEETTSDHSDAFQTSSEVYLYNI